MEVELNDVLKPSNSFQKLNFSVDAFDDNSRTIDFIFSTPVEDRSNDTVVVSGIDTSNFLKNPVFLWAHDKTKPPIGKVKDLKVENNILKGKVEFWRNPTDPAYWSEYDKLSVMLYEQYKKGFLKGVSIAFIPIEKILNKATGGVIYNKISLTEISAVPVPDNPEALSIGKGFCSLADIEIIKSICEETLKSYDFIYGKFKQEALEELIDSVLKGI